MGPGNASGPGQALSGPFRQASDRAADYLRARLLAAGTGADPVADLAAFYKAPYLFLISGDLPATRRVLNYVRATFMRPDGDFVTDGETKSENAAFQEYWSYPNGWLVIAAQKAGRFDLAQVGFDYLRRFYNPTLDGFVTHRSAPADAAVLDVLTNAHLGLVALYLGDLEKARAAGRMLARCAERQPDTASGFYLRLDVRGEPVTAYTADNAMFHQVSAVEPDQAFFMIGYPMAFLGKLYQATGDAACLATAQRYLEFALSCGETIRRSHFAHKVAWGAAVLARLTVDRSAADLALAIAQSLLDSQDQSGAWLVAEPPIVSLDQTAEVAIWLREIAGELG